MAKTSLKQHILNVLKTADAPLTAKQIEAKLRENNVRNLSTGDFYPHKAVTSRVSEVYDERKGGAFLVEKHTGEGETKFYGTSALKAA